MPSDASRADYAEPKEGDEGERLIEDSSDSKWARDLLLLFLVLFGIQNTLVPGPEPSGPCCGSSPRRSRSRSSPNGATDRSWPPCCWPPRESVPTKSGKKLTESRNCQQVLTIFCSKIHNIWTSCERVPGTTSGGWLWAAWRDTRSAREPRCWAEAASPATSACASVSLYFSRVCPILSLMNFIDSPFISLETVYVCLVTISFDHILSLYPNLIRAEERRTCSQKNLGWLQLHISRNSSRRSTVASNFLRIVKK